MTHPADRIRNQVLFEIRQGWKAYITIAGIIAVVILLFSWRDDWLKAEGVAVEATIRSMGVAPIAEKYAPGTIEVVAVSADGVFGRASVPVGRLDGCRVGDRIPADKVGSSPRLDPRPCRGAEVGTPE